MDYTDIQGKIEELQSGITELSDLIDRSYGGVFHDGNEIILGGMLHTLKVAKGNLEAVKVINVQLSDAAEKIWGT